VKSVADEARESAERWARVRTLVEKAVLLPPDARSSFLASSCVGDDALRSRVGRLTASYERADESWGFLAQSAGELVAPLLVAALSPMTDDLLPRLTAALADRYRIERELGAGGMATVYLAHDVRHGRQVAIKVLHPHLSAAVGADRFLTEIRTTAALQHPHILPLFDSGAADGLLFFVMPLVEGETLRSRLTREKQLPVADALQIASDVAGALAYAHRRGVIHRDIKPENILLHEGRPVIADFGIALAVQSAGALRVTQPGMSLGTPQYMSPEQTTGEQDLTARSDIYALGAVTYEMLIGEPPFTGATAQQVAARVRTEEPRALTTQRKHVPAHVEAAVLKALEKVPADRFESAAEFARALSDPAFDTPFYRTVWPRNERQRQRILVGALGISTIALAVVALWGWTRAEDVSSEVVAFTMPLPRDVSIASTSATADMAISPDGRVVVFSGIAADGTRRLYARTLADVEPHVLAGTDGATEPFFSPDGHWIAFWSGDRMQKVAATGGVPQTVTSMRGTGGTWTVNDIIVFGSNTGLFFVSSDGGVPRPVTASNSEPVLQFVPVALPDGDHVLFTEVGRESVSIGIAALSSRSARSLGIAGTSVLGFIDGHVIYATRDNSLMAVSVDASTGRTRGVAVPVATEVNVGVVGAAKAALSLSGTLAYRRGEFGSRLVLTDGRDEPETLLSEPQGYSFPRFSPDGKLLAISIEVGTRSDIWIHDLASGTRKRLSSGGSANERPEWTPDGSRVLYRTDEGAGSSIWWRAADLGTPSVPLVQEATPRGFFYEGVITPNGRAIVYQRNNDVELRALTGDTTPTMVAVSEAMENQARVSPDGRWVAFVTDESGSEEVVVQPLGGPGRRVQVSLTGGTEPVWSRDGGRLFYRANRKFIVATVTTEPAFAVVSRAVFGQDRFVPAASPHANYDVAPDGKHLLVLEPLEDSPILIVRNWATEVRAKLKANRR